MQKRFLIFWPTQRLVGSNSSHTVFLLDSSYQLFLQSCSTSVQYSPSTSFMSGGHAAGPLAASASAPLLPSPASPALRGGAASAAGSAGLTASELGSAEATGAAPSTGGAGGALGSGVIEPHARAHQGARNNQPSARMASDLV